MKYVSIVLALGLLSGCRSRTAEPLQTSAKVGPKSEEQAASSGAAPICLTKR